MAYYMYGKYSRPWFEMVIQNLIEQISEAV